MPNEFKVKNGLIVDAGTTTITGSLTTSGSSTTIGNTTITGSLGVSGSSNLNGNVTITGSASNSLHVRGSGATSATNALRIENSNTTASFIIRDDGNVAINNTSPGSLLTLNTSFASTNGLTISSDNSSDAQIILRRAASKPVLSFLAFDTATYISNGVYYDGGNWIHHSDGNDNSILAFDPGVGASWFASNDGAGSWNVASNITLWDSTSYWKSLVQSTLSGDSYFTGGNVGIGTSSPTTTLDVSGATNTTSLRIEQRSLTKTSKDTITANTTGSTSCDEATSQFQNFRSMHIKYNLQDSIGGNYRAGTVMAITDGGGTNITSIDTATSDIGNTSAVTLSVILTNSGQNMTLQVINGLANDVDILTEYTML